MSQENNPPNPLLNFFFIGVRRSVDESRHFARRQNTEVEGRIQEIALSLKLFRSMIDRAKFLREERNLLLFVLVLLLHMSYVVCIIHRLAGEQLDEREGADEFVNGARLYLHGSNVELLLWTRVNKLGGPFLRVIKCSPREGGGHAINFQMEFPKFH